MGKIMRVSVVVMILISLSVLYFVLRGICVWRQGYSWQDMDWNNDGRTSISEFFSASDIGKREVLKDGKTCTEYYAYKDGLPVRVDCQK